MERSSIPLREEKTMKPYVYIVVRKDIDPCNYAPQIAHAALESGYRNCAPYNTTHIVVLQVENKEELKSVELALLYEGIGFERFLEGFNDMGLTAIATFPITKPAVNSYLRQLPLFSY